MVSTYDEDAIRVDFYKTWRFLMFMHTLQDVDVRQNLDVYDSKQKVCEPIDKKELNTYGGKIIYPDDLFGYLTEYSLSLFEQNFSIFNLIRYEPDDLKDNDIVFMDDIVRYEKKYWSDETVEIQLKCFKTTCNYNDYFIKLFCNDDVTYMIYLGKTNNYLTNGSIVTINKNENEEDDEWIFYQIEFESFKDFFWFYYDEKYQPVCRMFG